MSTRSRILTMVGVAAMWCALPAAHATVMITFNLEAIGVDGSVVPSVTKDGVTITFAPAAGNMIACTYDDTSPICFQGQGLNINAALNPANVSGDRFISTVPSTDPLTTIQEATPLVFGFSELVMEFGFTTLDLLENEPGTNRNNLSLTGDGGASIDAKGANQGASGIDVDWAISSAAFDITMATFDGNNPVGAAYGIDDLFVVISGAPESAPEPATLALLALGLAGLGFVRKRRH